MNCPYINMGVRCVLNSGHDDDHQPPRGAAFSDDPDALTCSYTDDRGQCVLADGHKGDHDPQPGALRVLPDAEIAEREAGVQANVVLYDDLTTPLDTRPLSVPALTTILQGIRHGFTNDHGMTVKIQDRHDGAVRSVRYVKLVYNTDTEVDELHIIGY